MKRYPLSTLIENYLAPLTGVILLFYLLLLLYKVPNFAFAWNSKYEVFWVQDEITQTASTVNVGDKMVKIGGLLFSEYMKPVAPPIWTLVTSRNTLPLQVERDGQILDIDWPISPMTPGEFNSRLLNFIPAFICLALALVVQFFMRPKNLSRRMLLIVLCLTSIWLFTGARNDVNMPLADILYRIAIWLWMPSLLYLMWIYPYSLGALSNRVVVIIYLVAMLLCVAQITDLLPRYTYLVFFMFTILVGLVLFGLHFLRKRSSASTTH